MIVKFIGKVLEKITYPFFDLLEAINSENKSNSAYIESKKGTDLQCHRFYLCVLFCFVLFDKRDMRHKERDTFSEVDFTSCYWWIMKSENSKQLKLSGGRNMTL